MPSVGWRFLLLEARLCPGFYDYSTHYLICTKVSVIVDVGAKSAPSTNEVNATRIMADRLQERFEIEPPHLIDDIAHGEVQVGSPTK
jgi:hypothetical protein